MKLSIVTCSYNSEKYIQQTLQSVWNQKISEKHSIQHVILDGFSTDATIDIANEYKKNVEGRIQVDIVQSTPKWIYNAFNEGVKASIGDYVLVLPSDDFLEPNVLDDYLNFIESTGWKDLYYALRNTFNHNLQKNIGTPYPNKKIYYHGLNHFLLGLSCYISQPTVIARRDLHERFGFYNESLKLVSDWEFFIKITLGGATSQFYNKVVTNFRIHDESATTGKVNPEILGVNEENYVFKKYYGLLWYVLIFLRKCLRLYFKYQPLWK